MPQRSRSALLSRRQFECLQGVADLLDSTQIADRLGISAHTVNSHLMAAVAALGASSRRDAVRKYLLLQAEHPDKVTGQFLRMSSGEYPLPATPETAVVQEPPSSFDWSGGPVSRPAIGRDYHAVDRRLRTLAIVLAIAVGIVVLILAADPLVQSAMHVSNAIQPFTRQ